MRKKNKPSRSKNCLDRAYDRFDLQYMVNKGDVIPSLPSLEEQEKKYNGKAKGLKLDCNSGCVLFHDVNAERETTLKEHSKEWNEHRKSFFSHEISCIQMAQSEAIYRKNLAKQKKTELEGKIKDIEEKFKGSWLLTHVLRLRDGKLTLQRVLMAWWLCLFVQVFLILLCVSTDALSLYQTMVSSFREQAAMAIFLTVTAAVGLEMIPTMAGYVKLHLDYGCKMNNNQQNVTLLNTNKIMWLVFWLLLATLTVFRFVAIPQMVSGASNLSMSGMSVASSSGETGRYTVLVILMAVINITTSYTCYFLTLLSMPLYLKELTVLLESLEAVNEDIIALEGEEEYYQNLLIERGMSPDLLEELKTDLRERLGTSPKTTNDLLEERMEEMYKAEQDYINAYYDKVLVLAADAVKRLMPEPVYLLIIDKSLERALNEAANKRNEEHDSDLMDLNVMEVSA